MDPFEQLDEIFEEEFQKFMHGSYARTKDEDWERAAAQAPQRQPVTKCPHGKTPLSCHECYFSNPSRYQK